MNPNHKKHLFLYVFITPRIFFKLSHFFPRQFLIFSYRDVQFRVAGLAGRIRRLQTFCVNPNVFGVVRNKSNSHNLQSTSLTLINLFFL